MRFVLLVVFCINIAVTVHSQKSVVTKTIEPTSWGTFPVVKSEHVMGGLHSVTNTTERDAIHPDRREQGMVCHVTADNTYWKLIGGIANTNWVRVVMLEYLATKPADAAGSEGDLIYSSADKRYFYHNGTAWLDISSSSDDQSLTYNGATNVLSLEDGGAVDLSGLRNTDAQTLSITGTTLEISGGNNVDLSFLNADDQILSISGSDLTIADGNTIDISSVNTDNQDLSLTGNTLSLTNDASSVDLTAFEKLTEAQVDAYANNNGYALDIDVVKIAGAQTVTGVKTFSNGLNTSTVNFNAGTANQYSLPNVVGASGQILSTDGAGNTSWINNTNGVFKQTGDNISINTPTGNDNLILDDITLTGSTLTTHNDVDLTIDPNEARGTTNKTIIKGGIQIDNGTQGNGHVLTSDANGNALWRSVEGYEEMAVVELSRASFTLNGSGFTSINLTNKNVENQPSVISEDGGSIRIHKAGLYKITWSSTSNPVWSQQTGRLLKNTTTISSSVGVGSKTIYVNLADNDLITLQLRRYSSTYRTASNISLTVVQFTSPGVMKGTSVDSVYFENDTMFVHTDDDKLWKSDRLTKLNDAAVLQVRKTTNTNLNGTYSTISFNQKDEESNSTVIEHNTTNTDRIEIKETGYYQIYWSAVNEGDDAYDNVNNGRVIINGNVSNIISGSISRDAASCIVELTTGNYVSLQLSNQSGVNYSNEIKFSVQKLSVGDPSSGTQNISDILNNGNDAGGQKILNVGSTQGADPGTTVATKDYVDAIAVAGGAQNLQSVLGLGNVANNKITNLTDPTDAQDAATKAYVDANGGGNLDVTLGKGNSANNRQIKDLSAPTDNNDAATKAYVDANSGGDLDVTLGKGNDANGQKITGLGAPGVDSDAATKKYVDDEIAAAQHDPVTIGTANGLSLTNQQISMGVASATTTGAINTSAQTISGTKTFSNGVDVASFKMSGVAPNPAAEGKVLTSDNTGNARWQYPTKLMIFADPSTVTTYSDADYVYTCTGVDGDWYVERLSKTTYTLERRTGVANHKPVVGEIALVKALFP